MNSSTPTFTLRPRTRCGIHRTFLLDEDGMDKCRALSAKRGHPMLVAERAEKIVTLTSKRVTMQLPRSSSRLSKQSSSLSLSSSVSTESSLSSRQSSFLTRDNIHREEDYAPVVPYQGYQGYKCPNCECDRGAVNCHCDDAPDNNDQLSDSNAPLLHLRIGSSTDSLDSNNDHSITDTRTTSSSPHSGRQIVLSRSTSGLHSISKPSCTLTAFPEQKGNASTLPRASSSKLTVAPKSPSVPPSPKSWSSSLPRAISPNGTGSTRGRTSKKVRSVLSLLFGHNNNKVLPPLPVALQIKDELAEVTQEMEGLDLADGFTNLGIHDEKQNPKSTMLLVGKKKFNMDPKKGLEYLIENGLLRNTPEDISEFLFKGEGLSKRAIGDYLGERNDFNISVLKAFVNLHEFSDMLIVQALRQFLWSFRLPGEAQKIDRMMECFAQRYCELNPEHFSTTDTCYVLSFAIIMLNTSLHNPAVKDKPSVERFIDMNRGINDGKDLPPDLLTRVYDNIKKEPFKIPEDDGDDLIHTFFNPDKEGWLWKQASGRCGRYKTWKRRWFLLKDHCLYYFEFTQDKEPKGIIPLENIQIREANDRDKPNCFELYAANSDVIKACKTNTDGKVVEGKHTVYRMSASSSAEKEQWMKTIRQMIKSDTPFYSILAARRKKAQHE